MFLTYQKLKQYKPCVEGYIWFRQKYPNGAELLDVLRENQSFLQPQTLHWVRNHLPIDEREQKIYEELMGIKNCFNFCLSEDCENCSHIFDVKKAKDSKNIYKATEVEKSSDVIESESVEKSSQIFFSSLIESCNKVVKGTSVIGSVNICNSRMIVNSKNVINSTEVYNSSEIIGGTNITNSFFCQNCHNIKHCLFCSNLKDSEYYLFNKPVDKEKYEIFVHQYQKYQDKLLEFFQDWPSEIIDGNFKPVENDFEVWFSSMPDKFWKWARTLPNFDSMLIYNITMLPEILID